MRSSLNFDDLSNSFHFSGWDTNGRGLLLYQKFLFSVGLPILPVALRVHVPFLPIVISQKKASSFFC